MNRRRIVYIICMSPIFIVLMVLILLLLIEILKDACSIIIFSIIIICLVGVFLYWSDDSWMGNDD